MTNKMIHTPEGVRDTYGRELRCKHQIQSKLHDTLHTYGYRDIETPTFEFFDIYSNDVGTTPENEMYRFFDKEGNMLALRPDFTPSIARCAAKYFVEDSMPIRLCYEGKAFNNTSDLQGKLKESTQIGAELIGDASTDSDGEIICLVVESLLNAGLKDLNVCIGDAGYFKGICDAANLSEDITMELRNLISSKDYFGAEEFLLNNNVDKKYIDAILDVTKISSVEDLVNAEKLVDNARSLNAINHLKDVYAVVCSYGLQKYVSVDLGLLSKFNYYTGMLFKAYTYGTGDAIVKGGRYDSLLGKFGKPSSAVGFVLLVDDIMTALSTQGLLPDATLEETWIVYSEANKSAAINKAKDMRSNNQSVALISFDTTKSTKDYEDYAAKNDISKVEFML